VHKSHTRVSGTHTLENNMLFKQFQATYPTQRRFPESKRFVLAPSRSQRSLVTRHSEWRPLFLDSSSVDPWPLAIDKREREVSDFKQCLSVFI
jgi:hypothetical protein